MLPPTLLSFLLRHMFIWSQQPSPAARLLLTWKGQKQSCVSSCCAAAQMLVAKVPGCSWHLLPCSSLMSGNISHFSVLSSIEDLNLVDQLAVLCLRHSRMFTVYIYFFHYDRLIVKSDLVLVLQKYWGTRIVLDCLLLGHLFNICPKQWGQHFLISIAYCKIV